MVIKGQDLALHCMMIMRYSFGRMTYVVSVVTDFVQEACEELSTDEKKSLLYELERLFVEKNPGMDMDKACWDELARYLKKNT